MPTIQHSPRSATDWLQLAHGGKEIRARPGHEEGGIEIYGSRRSLFGKLFGFIKDPLFATQRADKRERSTAALRDFVRELTGLDEGDVQHAFQRAGLTRGTPLTRAVIGRAFAEVDRTVSAYQAEQPDNDSSPARKLLRTLGTEGANGTPRLREARIELSARTRRDIEAHNNGCMNAAMLKTLITHGQLDLGIDPHDPSLRITQKKREGAQSIGLFKIETDSRTLFVKESGGPLMELDPNDDHRRAIRPGDWAFQSYTPEGGVYTAPGGYRENRDLKTIDGTLLGSTREVRAPNGVNLVFAHAHTIFEFDARSPVVDAYGRLDRPLVRHQVSVLEAAHGEPLGDLLTQGTEQAQQEAVRAFGHAMGAMHIAFTDGEHLPTGGLRTLVHGDCHPGNVFYDAATSMITAIDLSGAAANFRRDPPDYDFPLDAPENRRVGPPGFDMLRDVKRTMEHAVFKTSAAMRQAFLESYAEGLGSHTDAEGRPYTVGRIEALLANRNLPSTALT